MAGWCWRWTSPAGCARRCIPRRSGSLSPLRAWQGPGIIPGCGIEVVDHALAQLEVLLESRARSREVGSSRQARMATRRFIGRSSPWVGQPSRPTYIQPRSVIMNLDASVGWSSRRSTAAGCPRAEPTAQVAKAVLDWIRSRPPPDGFPCQSGCLREPIRRLRITLTPRQLDNLSVYNRGHVQSVARQARSERSRTRHLGFLEPGRRFCAAPGERMRADRGSASLTAR